MKNATRNPQLSSLTTIETDGQKLSVFLKNLSLICLAHIGRLLLTLHEKKKPTPEKEWVYPELGFMS